MRTNNPVERAGMRIQCRPPRSPQGKMGVEEWFPGPRRAHDPWAWGFPCLFAFIDIRALYVYPGLKLTANGAKVIEYNARFGDPETQVYMRLLESDLLELITACVEGRMQGLQPRWRPDTFAVNIAVTSGGYPGTYRTGLPITGVDKASALEDVVIFHAGTARRNHQLVTNGGSVLYCSAIGSSIEEARNKAYAAVALIEFEGMHYRSDIGTKAMELFR